MAAIEAARGVKAAQNRPQKYFQKKCNRVLTYREYLSSSVHMARKKSNAPDDLIPTAVKLPRAMSDRIEELAQFVRGGKSEIIRRAILAGLPVVITQRGIRIPERRVHK